MDTHSCLGCERSFVAESQAEAEVAYKSQVGQSKTAAASFQDAVDTGEVAYARFCPYCGGTAIKVSS